MTGLSTVVKTGKIGLDHVLTTGVIALTMTGHSWTGIVTRNGTTMIGMTTGPGVLEVIPLHLSFVPASATNCIQQRCRDLRQFHWCAV